MSKSPIPFSFRPRAKYPASCATPAPSASFRMIWQVLIFNMTLQILQADVYGGVLVDVVAVYGGE